MKIPRKEELLKLQEKYKTDKKIGEALGGVPEYLVAYWRRKKKIGRYAFPKYSKEEIKDLWERYGNDQKAGEKLGISKAGFYKWRKRYEFLEKPKVLKFQQLDFLMSGQPNHFGRAGYVERPDSGNMTMAQKLLARKAGKAQTVVGEIVNVEPDLAMSHDNAGLVIKQFRQIGQPRVWNPDKIVIPLDHRAPAESEKTAFAHKSIREFVKEQGIKNFYDIKEGICHQVVIEKGHILPGQLAVGTDSHTTSYGCLGALSTGIGATEMAALWATGKIWLRVPESIKIVIDGKIPKGVYAKDVILFIIGQLTVEGASYKSVEFYGETVAKMSVSERFTLCNLSMEMGAKFAMVPFDRVTQKYLSEVTSQSYEPILSDSQAVFEKKYMFYVSKLEPQVACPHNVDNVKPVGEVKGIKIDQVVLGSCTNGRLDDLEIAAKILKGKKVHPQVRMLVLPATRTIYSQAIKKGYLQTFLDAGAVILNPGCGPCLGAHEGILAAGERCVATTNRNFKGRMGSPDSEVYLSSPALAAATAIQGKIADPREFL
ncbi:MAG: 3-isopropylmalate dehydratase large subunit [Candidatus Zixiibacteriota bacterium]